MHVYCAYVNDIPHEKVWGCLPGKHITNWDISQDGNWERTTVLKHFIHQAALSFYKNVYKCFCLHICLYTTCVQCPRKPERGVRYPGTGGSGGRQPSSGCWTSNMLSLEGKPVFLITESSLWLHALLKRMNLDYSWKIFPLSINFVLFLGVWICFCSSSWMDRSDLWLQTERASCGGGTQCLLLL